MEYNNLNISQRDIFLTLILFLIGYLIVWLGICNNEKRIVSIIKPIKQILKNDSGTIKLFLKVYLLILIFFVLSILKRVDLL